MNEKPGNDSGFNARIRDNYNKIEVRMPGGMLEAFLKNNSLSAMLNSRTRLITSFDLLAAVRTEKILVDQLERAVRHYAETNLVHIGTGNIYVTGTEENRQSDTKDERVAAVQLLLDLFRVSSAKEIYEYVTTPSFQKLVGSGEFKFNIFRNHLDKPVKEFIIRYRSFLLVATDEVLRRVLDNEGHALDWNNLALLFWQYNSEIVANYIVHTLKNPQFSAHTSGLPMLDFGFLIKFLDSDPESIKVVNQGKMLIKAVPILPLDYRLPGKSSLVDENLTRDQLYQYDEQTILAAEQYLRTRFRHLFFNKTLPDCATASRAPYLFYQVPAGKYMAFDPLKENSAQNRDLNYFRYENFRDDLRSLLDSYKPAEHKQPIIFIGILNTKTHYLPYIIFKNSSAKIQIITVDPSPLMHPSDNLSTPDMKLSLQRLLQNMFEDIFPGQEYRDLNICQMLRERDCGPNSIITIRDALRSCETESPFLAISEDRLVVNESRLTIHFHPIGFDPYTETFVYPKEVEEQSLQNRSDLQAILAEITQVSTLTVRNPSETPLSIFDRYELSEQITIDYNYHSLVEGQEQQDLKETNISAVQLQLESFEEGRRIKAELITEYRHSLTLPDASLLISFIRQRVTSMAEMRILLSAHDNNIEKLAEDVISVIIRDSIPQALRELFSRKYLSDLPYRVDLNAEEEVEKFLIANMEIYQKLSIHIQRQLKWSLVSVATPVVQAKLIDVHLKIFERLLRRKARAFLGKISSDVDDSQLLNAVVDLKEFADSIYPDELILQTLSFLRSNALAQTHALLATAAKKVQDQVTQSILSRVMPSLNIEHKKLADILEFIEEDGFFRALSQQQFRVYLNQLEIFKNSHYTGLMVSEINSFLGGYVLARLNNAIYEQLSAQLNGIIEASVKRFMSNPLLQSALLGNGAISEISTKLNAQSELVEGSFSDEDLSRLIEEFGNEETIILSNYKNTYIKQKVNHYLKMAIASLYITTLNMAYTRLADDIIGLNLHRLTLDSFIAMNTAEELGATLRDQMLRHYVEQIGTASLPGVDSLIIKAGDGSFSLTVHGLRFTSWFFKDIIQSVLSNHLKCYRLAENIEILHACIASLNEVIKDNEANEFLSEMQSALSLIHEKLKLLTYDKSFEKKFTDLEAMFLRKLYLILSQLHANFYESDCFTANSLTVRLRPIFCQMLNISVRPILSFQEIKEVDKLIINNITHLSSGHRVRPQQELLVIESVESLPNCENQPLTRNLLLQFIFRWFTDYALTKYRHPRLWMEDKMDPVIRDLMALVNFPNSSDEYIVSSCKQMFQELGVDSLYKRLRLYRSHHLTDQILARILSTSAFRVGFAQTRLSYQELMDFISPTLARFQNTTKVKTAGLRKIMQASASQSAQESLLMLDVEPTDEKRVNAKLIFLEKHGIDAAQLDQLAKVKLQYLQEKARTNTRSQTLIQLNEDNATVVADFPTITLATARLETIEEELLKIINRQLLDILMRHPEKSRTQAIDQILGLIKMDDSQPSTRVRPSFTSAIQSVKKEELAQSGFPVVLAFFNKDLTTIEKNLKEIKAKHGNTRDFSLDEEDIEFLHVTINQRWRRLFTSEGVAAKFHYLTPLHRRDKVYIAIAEVLAQYYCEVGKEISSLDILMPGYPLVTRKFPEKICELLYIDEGNVGEIMLGNLILTRTGYALDINWIIQLFLKTKKLCNPYTDENFSRDEIDDIYQHPKSNELTNLIKSTFSSGVTERAINYLRDYLNESFFDSGIKGYYNDYENELAFKAYNKFMTRLSAYPAEKEALLKSIIPGSAQDTVESMFGDATVRVGKVSARGICITNRSANQARVVIAYKGSNHGLLSHTLLKKASAINPVIEPRRYGDHRQSGSDDPPVAYYLEKANLVQSRPGLKR